MISIAKFTFNPFQENTYVLHSGNEGIIVDPGCYDGTEERELADWLAENAITPVRLVLTHAHIDHVLGCAWARDRYGLLPEVHRADLAILHGAERVGAMYGVPCVAVPEPTRFLEEGDVLILGNTHLDVLFVPGHAPGHVAFFCPEQRFIISGDTLFHRSIGRTDLPGGDTATLLDSIRTKLYPLGDDVVVYSGHGPETTIGEERRSNPFVQG